jgi:phage terminase large subunit
MKIDPIEEWTDYHIWNHFKLKGKPVNEAWFKNLWFDRHAEFIYRKGAFAYPWACEVLKHLKSKGHKIIFISAQPSQKCMGLTVQWLSDWKVPWNEIHFTDYESKAKVDCDVYIEDSPAQCKKISNKVSFAQIWIYNQPWNKEYREHSFCHGYDSWLEIEKEINRRFQ